MRREPRMLRIVRRDEASGELWVECPRRGRFVRLERCLSCGFGHGMEVVRASEAYLRCCAEDGGPAPRGGRHDT